LGGKPKRRVACFLDSQARSVGHAIDVSAKHYLQVPAELYERAAAGKSGSALQNALQHGPAHGGTERQIA
jgi:hypothetical protein